MTTSQHDLFVTTFTGESVVMVKLCFRSESLAVTRLTTRTDTATSSKGGEGSGQGRSGTAATQATRTRACEGAPRQEQECVRARLRSARRVRPPLDVRCSGDTRACAATQKSARFPHTSRPRRRSPRSRPAAVSMSARHHHKTS
jgi:hypothetical protein